MAPPRGRTTLHVNIYTKFSQKSTKQMLMSESSCKIGCDYQLFLLSINLFIIFSIKGLIIIKKHPSQFVKAQNGIF